MELGYLLHSLFKTNLNYLTIKLINIFLEKIVIMIQNHKLYTYYCNLLNCVNKCIIFLIF